MTYYDKITDPGYYKVVEKKPYIVTFCNGTEHDHKFSIIKAQNKDVAYSKAIIKFGFMVVSGVYPDTPYVREKLRMKGFEPIQK